MSWLHGWKVYVAKLKEDRKAEPRSKAEHIYGMGTHCVAGVQNLLMG